MKPLKTLSIAASLLVSSLCAASSGAASTDYHYPGGIVDLKLEKQSKELPDIKYGIRDVAVLDGGTHWRVLIGIGLDTLPGDYLVYVKSSLKKSNANHLKLSIRQYNYPFHEQLSIQPESLRIEHETLSEIDFVNTQQPSLPLRPPAKGHWSESFGHHFFDRNTNKLSVQNLISLATTQLLSVVSPQNAIVSKVTTNDNEISTVYLDHGRGLYSIVSGITDLSVEAGNGILAGAVIGKLPSQHSNEKPSTLIWQVILNGVYVNPILLTQV